MHIIAVVGARPNFMKMAPVHRALAADEHTCYLVHTGQHYDAAMSGVFFDELGLPPPDINLEVGSASHAVQTARIMERFEPVLQAQQATFVLVVGDVNSTLACALVAAKRHVPVAHLEAGVRSYDRRMPEEINRLCIDPISDLLLTPSLLASANLQREAIAPERIVCVGNIMVDSVDHHVAAARRRLPALCAQLNVAAGTYALATVHRPSNVDDPAVLTRLLTVLQRLSQQMPLVWTGHPRTLARLQSGAAWPPHPTPIPPMGYIDFLALQAGARLVLTDSGGVQEETTALGVPCLTLRDATEWPETLEYGTNELVGTDPDAIFAAVGRIVRRPTTPSQRPPLWDGQAASRVVQAMHDFAGAAT